MAFAALIDGRKGGAVKEIIAVVKPFLAERVLEALKLAPLEACTVREVKGYGRQKNYLDRYGDDARVDEVIERVLEVARTGRMGDGKVFVMPVIDCLPG